MPLQACQPPTTSVGGTPGPKRRRPGPSTHAPNKGVFRCSRTAEKRRRFGFHQRPKWHFSPFWLKISQKNHEKGMSHYAWIPMAFGRTVADLSEALEGKRSQGYKPWDLICYYALYLSSHDAGTYNIAYAVCTFGVPLFVPIAMLRRDGTDTCGRLLWPGLYLSYPSRASVPWGWCVFVGHTLLLPL